MKILVLFIVSTSFFALGNEDILEYIQKNYEYNISLVEQTNFEHGIKINLSAKDRTIDLSKIEEIIDRHYLPELGFKLNFLKKYLKNQLTELEKKLLILYPKQGYYIGYQSFIAQQEVKYKFQKKFIGKPIDTSDPKVDSFKHTYWSHLLTTGVNPEFAKLWFTARELGKKSDGLKDLRDDPKSYMDMLNNIIGMKIPEARLEDQIKGNSVPSQISHKLKNGKLYYNDNGIIRTTDNIN